MMINVTQTLKTYTSEIIQSLNDIPQDTFDKVVSIEILCEDLARLDATCHGTEESSKVFTYLHNNGMNKMPAVYWFEIISDHTALDIRTAFDDLRTSEILRSVPAISKRYNQDSKVLYVGKGKANLSGRMFLHLGYQLKGSSQGLQLCHWNYDGVLKGLKLRINIIYLPANLAELASTFELKLAKELQPILGKHR